MSNYIVTTDNTLIQNAYTQPSYFHTLDAKGNPIPPTVAPSTGVGIHVSPSIVSPKLPPAPLPISTPPVRSYSGSFKFPLQIDERTGNTVPSPIDKNNTPVVGGTGNGFLNLLLGCYFNLNFLILVLLFAFGWASESTPYKIFLSIFILYIIITLWGLIQSIICFRKKGNLFSKIIGILIVSYFGPFYWLYYRFNKNYCYSRIKNK